MRDIPSADRPGALFVLTAIAGVAMIIAGVLRLGRYVRFVPHSVMVGFLSGVAVNIVCGQLPDLTGVDAQGSISVAKAIDVLTHPRSIELASLAVGLLAIALIAVFSRTRLTQVSAVIALVVPSVLVAVLSLSEVMQVNDGGAFPSGIPIPALPELHYLTSSVLLGAFAVAVLVLVQGAGVSEAAPNPDRTAVDTNPSSLLPRRTADRPPRGRDSEDQGRSTPRLRLRC